jgi:folate-binding protein YgfZ
MTEGYEALRRGAAVLNLNERGRIAVRGRDRVRLLHNITSNDVKKMTPGSGCYAFLLNPQGRIQADLNLFCFDSHFLIDTAPDLREKVHQHIRRYIIADQVELEDISPETGAVGVEGPKSADVLAAISAPVPAGAYAHLPWGESTIANVSLTGQPGFRIIGGRRQLEDLVRALHAAGARDAPADEARVVRIENGKPLYGEDIRETSLPQETQQMHGFSFTKGCYLGQEIVERIRAQGHVNKKLVRVEIDGAEPLAAGIKLTAEAGEAGEVTSSVYSPDMGKLAGMAYVRTPFADAGTLLRAGDRTVRVL